MGILLGGIGGYLKNREVRILYMFSGLIAVKNSQDAEIEAMIHLIRLILHHSYMKRTICICSDSTTAIASMRDGLQTYVPVHELIPNLKDLVGRDIQLDYVSRELNVSADSLAKIGLQRPSTVTYWA